MEGDDDESISGARDDDSLAAHNDSGAKYNALNEEVLLKLQLNDPGIVSIKGVAKARY